MPIMICTLTKIQRNFKGTSTALQQHFNNTSTAQRKNCWCFYQHWLRESVSPKCKIFTLAKGAKKIIIKNVSFLQIGVDPPPPAPPQNVSLVF